MPKRHVATVCRALTVLVVSPLAAWAQVDQQAIIRDLMGADDSRAQAVATLHGLDGSQFSEELRMALITALEREGELA